jgi:hypothetical protein
MLTALGTLCARARSWSGVAVCGRHNDKAHHRPHVCARCARPPPPQPPSPTPRAGIAGLSIANIPNTSTPFKEYVWKLQQYPLLSALVKFGVSFPLAYHLLGGLRHLVRAPAAGGGRVVRPRVVGWWRRL